MYVLCFTTRLPNRAAINLHVTVPVHKVAYFHHL